MSKRQRLAVRALQAMSASERAAIRERAASALRPAQSDTPMAHTLRLAAHVVLMPCSERSVKDGLAVRGKRYVSSVAGLPTESESESERLAWERLGDMLSASRDSQWIAVQTNPLLASERRADKAQAKALAIHREIALAASAVDSCEWISRAFRSSLAPAKPVSCLVRARQYPLGYASSRSGWSYRAGAERSTVAGAVSTVAVTVERRALTQYVSPERLAGSPEPALALKWYGADYRQIGGALRPVITDVHVVTTQERADYSLAASGIDTASGFKSERSGPSYRAGSGSLADTIYRLAAQARRHSAKLARRASELAASQQARAASERAAIERRAERERALRPRLAR
jgi:hypothetical protein